MKKFTTSFMFIVALITAGSVFAEGSSGSASFAQKLPEFSLEDPGGKTFTNESLSKDGLVLVVTAPTLKNNEAQEGWDKQLSKSKSGSKAKLVFIEDLEQSSFKKKALSGMKKAYEPGREPILLIDNKGKVRRALKAPEKKTVVLVYDHDGKLIYSETGNPSAQAAETIWKKAKDSTH